ncbi:MAG TPA: Ig-like domain repeat protein [Candidatus Angelobacter sp.]|nr:Ig-like domain repeat protein [Candidatus Angelobacter sp.]
MRHPAFHPLSGVLLVLSILLPLSFCGQNQAPKKPTRSSQSEPVLQADEGPVRRVKGHIPKDRRTFSARPASAPEDDTNGEVSSFRVLSHPREDRLRKGHTFHGDLRTLPQIPPEKFERPELEGPEITPVPFTGRIAAAASQAAQATGGPSPSAPAPALTNSFEGLDFTNWGAGHPPDTNGDVGPQYYIQTINTSVGIYNKSDGTRVTAFIFNTLMSQGHFGNLCDTSNFGDPVVLYDTFEDRWIITDFAFNLSGGNVVAPEFQCFAVSKSGDPVAGGWNFYSIQVNGGFGDYPKLGIWPDGLYMSANVFGFGAGGTFQNVRVWALNKAQMYAGDPTVQVLSFDAPSAEFTLLPSNARLQTGTPPTGSPNYFSVVAQFLNTVSVYKLHADWNNISTSTFSGPFLSLTSNSWSQLSAANTSEQSPGNKLDTLYFRLMVQNQYTNLGGVESLWNAHTVGASGATSTQSAVRYYQVKVTGGTVESNATQAFTYSPDATIFRFMPSVAVDRAGDMAIGYSATNATLNPAIRYAGRLAGDPVNSITQTEQSFIEGTGTQSGTCGSTCTRWGDYSAMTLDPDGCTFWYTNMYYQTTGLAFNTRIGDFSFPGCTPAVSGALQGTVSISGSGNSINGATVALGTRTTTTDVNGAYSFSGLPSGTYPSITVSFPGYNSVTLSNIVINDGLTTTQDFSLTPAPASGCLTDTTQADFQAGVPTNCDLTSSPGDITLVNAPSIDQQNTTLGNNGVGITTTTFGGQTFTPAVTGQLIKADINLFCSGCTGTTPNLTLSLRATSGNLPTGADLASATITGFSSGSAVYYTGTFSSPPTLTAGTKYALVIRPTVNPSPGTYALTRSGTSTAGSDVYAGGTRVAGATSGTVWSIPLTGGVSTDAGFRVFIQSGFASPGTFVSSTKDANPPAGSSASWGTLTWTADTPSGSAIQFQAAGSNNAAGPFSFVGPDGTAATFFTNGGSLAQFNGNRYLKYQASFSTNSGAVTPTLHDVTVCFSDATVTTLTVVAATGTFGSTVNLSATLTANSTGLSGQTVSFTLNGSSAGSAITDSSGLATLSSVSLTGISVGSYPSGVAASFAGDTNNGASSGSNSLTVNQASTTTGITSSANPSVFGQSVTFTATVSPVAPGAGTPTGTVTFLDGGSPVGTGTLSGGVATFTTSALAVGNHTITTSYGGDTNFTGSTGSLTGNPQVVTKADTATTVISSQNPSIVGQSVTFTATVSPVAPGAGTPTGTVTFLDGGSPIGTGTLSGGVVTFTTSTLTSGSHTITTSYGGDGCFNASTGSLTGNPQVVTNADTSTAVTSSQNPSVFGQSVTFTATVSPVAPGAGTPTGTVTFLDGGSSIGTGTLSGGVATFTTSALAAGNHTITTSYGGDASFNGDTGSLTGNPQVVNKSDTTTGVTSSVNPSVFGQSVTFTATVSPVAPGAGTPAGTVTFLDGGSPIGTGTLSGGVATFTTSALAVGNHTITTSYGGDGNFNGSIGSLTGNPQVVNKSDTATNVTSSQNPSVLSQSVTFTATVSPVAPGTGTPTGTVTFLDGGSPVGTGTLSGGVATFTTSALAVGNHTITTSYGGDGNFNGSTGSLTGNPQVVNKASSTTSVVSSQNPSIIGQSVTFTATVSPVAPAAGTPTGTVTFLDGGSPIGTGTLSGGVAAFTTSALTVGNRTITTSYGGDGTFNGSTGSLTGNPQVVNKADTATTVTSSQNPSSPGQSVTFTATVSPVAPGTGTPTGTVTFLDGGSSIGTGTLSGGVATFTTSTLAAGNHTITTSYGGNGTFNGSTGSLTGNPQVVLAADLTIAVAHTGNFIQGDINKTYTITVSNTGTAPTGAPVTVTDTLPAGLIATGISGSGWTCNALPVLSCSRSNALNNGTSYPAITLTVLVALNAPASVTNTATVSGGGEVNTSNNTAADLTTINALPGPPLNIAVSGNNAATVTQGNTATYVFTVTSLSAQLTGIHLACANLPALSTCSFSPQDFTGASTPVTLTISTTANTALALPPPGGKNNIPLLVALLLPAFIVAPLTLGRKKSRAVRLRLAFVMGMMLLFIALAGCGGHPTTGMTANNGTPAGAYSITVTATSSAVTPQAQASTMVNLNVQ